MFMALFRSREQDEGFSYSAGEAAEFLQFDPAAVEYWLRMGHLLGDWDERGQRWRIQPQALIDFLHEAGEPMPTGDPTLALNNEVRSERVPVA